MSQLSNINYFNFNQMPKETFGLIVSFCTENLKDIFQIGLVNKQFNRLILNNESFENIIKNRFPDSYINLKFYNTNMYFYCKKLRKIACNIKEGKYHHQIFNRPQEPTYFRTISSLTVHEGKPIFISVLGDNTIQLLDLSSTGQRPLTLEGQQEPVSCITAHNNLIISGSSGGTIKIWNLKTGKEEKTLASEGDQEEVSCVTVHKGLLFSGSSSGKIKIWDLETKKVLPNLRGQHQGKVCSITVHEDQIISSSLDSTIKIWDLDSGYNLLTLEEQEQKISSTITIHDDRIIAGLSDGTIKIWDLKTGQGLMTLTGQERISCMRSCGNKLVTGSLGGMIHVWDLNTGGLLRLNGHTNAISCIQIHDNKIFSGSLDTTIKIWDLNSGEELLKKQSLEHEKVVSCILFNEGKLISSSCLDRRIAIWDFNSAEFLQETEPVIAQG